MDEVAERMPQGLLFDMDGVLVDSTPLHAEAFQEVLRRAGVADFHYPPYAGMRTREVVADALARRGISAGPNEIERLAAAKIALAASRMKELNPVFPHALDVLERLSVRFPLALVSSGSEGSVCGFIEASGLQGLFRAILHGGDVALAKPAPDGYLEAARRLGLEPSRCLVLEDANAGEAAARAAGCEVWRIGNGLALPDLLGRLGLSETRVTTAPPPRKPFPHRPAGNWTAVIAAAGRGTRLGSDRPKVLFEIAGRTILEWLLDLLLPRCEWVVVVAAPWSAPAIGKAAADRSSRVRIAIQSEPVGMADAVGCGLSSADTENVLVIWGDQAAVLGSSLDCAMRLHTEGCALATVPTVVRKRPYIHLERDASGRITTVLQAREGDALPAEGESDTGVFLFRTRTLRRSLDAMRRAGSGLGKVTREWNLLPVLSELDTLPGNVLSARIMTEEESVGVNTPVEADFLASILAARNQRQEQR